MSSLVELVAPRVVPGAAKVRWGVAWFVVLMVALWIDVRAVALVQGAVGALAAWQAATALGGDRVLAAAVTGSAVAAAGLDARLMGVIVIAAVAGSLLVSLAVSTKGSRGAGLLARTGTIVTAWLVPTLAAGSVTIAADRELGAAVILVWLVAMFDAGVYLVGAETGSRWNGLVAGILGAIAVVYTATQLAVPPLEPAAMWRFAALAAVTLPLGPALCRYLGCSDGWAVRRLDALLVTGPAWALSVDLVVT